MSPSRVLNITVCEERETPDTDLDEMLIKITSSIHTCHLLIKYVLDHHDDAKKMIALKPMLELHVAKLDDLAGRATSKSAKKLVDVLAKMINDSENGNPYDAH